VLAQKKRLEIIETAKVKELQQFRTREEFIFRSKMKSSLLNIPMTDIHSLVPYNINAFENQGNCIKPFLITAHSSVRLIVSKLSRTVKPTRNERLGAIKIHGHEPCVKKACS
jgi:hypothetical protein